MTRIHPKPRTNNRPVCNQHDCSPVYMDYSRSQSRFLKNTSTHNTHITLAPFFSPTFGIVLVVASIPPNPRTSNHSVCNQNNRPPLSMRSRSQFHFFKNLSTHHSHILLALLFILNLLNSFWRFSLMTRTQVCAHFNIFAHISVIAI